MNILYSIGCPRCNVLKKKLDDKGIEYYTIADEEQIKAAGISILPVLEIEGERLDYPAAVKWVNEQ